MIRDKIETERYTLYLADCMDVLPTLADEAIVTDPPYGIGERMQGGTWGAKKKYEDFRKWDVAPSQAILDAFKRQPQAIVWGGNYFTLPPSRCWLAWDKRNAVPTMADVELAWTNFDKPAKRFSWPVGVHTSGHPTEKPVALMSWCVGMVDSETVADFYMGSGTTGVACMKLGRKFIGVEIDPTYFAVAARRIAAADDAGVQGALFDPQP